MESSDLEPNIRDETKSDVQKNQDNEGTTIYRSEGK